MNRTCSNCGSKNSFGSRYCEQCGHKLDVKFDFLSYTKLFKKMAGNMKYIVLSIIVILLLVFVLSSFNTVENALDVYYRGVQKNRIEDFMYAFPAQASSVLRDKNIDGLNLTGIEVSLDKQYSDYYYTYGDRFRIRYKVQVKEYWSRADIEKAKQSLNEIWGIPKSSVQQIITVGLRVEVKNNEIAVANMIFMNMIKIHNKWYVYPVSEAFLHPLGVSITKTQVKLPVLQYIY